MPHNCCLPLLMHNVQALFCLGDLVHGHAQLHRSILQLQQRTRASSSTTAACRCSVCTLQALFCLGDLVHGYAQLQEQLVTSHPALHASQLPPAICSAGTSCLAPCFMPHNCYLLLLCVHSAGALLPKRPGARPCTPAGASCNCKNTPRASRLTTAVCRCSVYTLQALFCLGDLVQGHAQLQEHLANLQPVVHASPLRFAGALLPRVLSERPCAAAQKHLAAASTHTHVAAALQALFCLGDLVHGHAQLQEQLAGVLVQPAPVHAPQPVQQQQQQSRLGGFLPPPGPPPASLRVQQHPLPLLQV
jgi:hypothetical protein